MDQQQQKVQPSSARRKLIRGSFAAPVVLTLHSGASMAAASVNSCLVRHDRNSWNDGVAEVVSSPDDVWLRYRLWGYVKNGKINSDAGLWIKGSDLSAYRVGGDLSRLATSAYQRFDEQAQALDPRRIEYSKPNGPSDCTWTQVNKYVSLRVNRRGELVSIGKSHQGFHVSESCWSSFVTGHRT